MYDAERAMESVTKVSEFDSSRSLTEAEASNSSANIGVDVEMSTNWSTGQKTIHEVTDVSMYGTYTDWIINQIMRKAELSSRSETHLFMRLYCEGLWEEL